MAQPIPKKPYPILSSSHISSHLVTPNGTPPADPSGGHYDPVIESRLHQLLSTFDAGTHTIDREERESPAERRMSFGSASDTFPTPPPSRRPSFLSSLGIRPFSFASSSSSGNTPISALHPKDSFAHHMGLGMTSNAAVDDNEANSKPITNCEGIKSLSHLPQLPVSTDHGVKESTDRSLTDFPTHMVRSKTTGHIPNKQSGFVPRKEQPIREEEFPSGEKKQHFDPSRDPRLLGLI
ncbi:hypothetical protein L204_100373 [Cryptococcus depauperatus]|nr:hypothetical protein L204_02144 [Cryptococcus depauperatus CBS 7855]